MRIFNPHKSGIKIPDNKMNRAYSTKKEHQNSIGATDIITREGSPKIDRDTHKTTKATTPTALKNIKAP